ncbi:hypothetical protein ACIQAC_18665 [Streptomyces sp. NPDC088387]|uniref:hypothetical protein n=1 Tax=Streptomyces sp. NPDC088387 TaxID=3365859 RepID=UPI00381B54C6
MADRHRTGEDGEPVPRDMPDQLAGEGDDPWDITPDLSEADKAGTADKAASADKAEDVPDTDEAGTSRRDESNPASPQPEDPHPDESPA